MSLERLGFRTSTIAWFKSPIHVAALAARVRGVLLESITCGLRAILVALEWPLGAEGRLPKPDSKGANGLGEGLSVMAFILTQLVALSVSQIGRRPLRDEATDFQMATFFTYSLLGVAAFGTLVIMIRLTTVGEEGRRQRVFGHGALTFLRWILVCGLGLVLIFGRMAWCGELPTQAAFKKVPVRLIHAEPHLFKLGPKHVRGTEGISGLIAINKADFPDGVPKRMFLDVVVGPKILDANWRVIGGKLFVGEPESGKEHESLPDFEPYLNILDGPPARTFEVTLSDLKPDGRYTMELFLWAPEANRGSRKAILELLNDPKQEAMTVVALLRAN